MATLSADQIADLVLLTLKELGRGRWSDLTSDLQEHIFLPRILKEKRVQFAGSMGPRRQVMTQDSGAARHVGLYSRDSTNVVDVMTYAHVGWRHTETHYTYDEREPEFNSGPAQIVDIIKVRRAASLLSLAKLMEETWWSRPGPADDLTTPFGVYYWIVKWITGTATPGFLGANGNPVGTDDVTITGGAGNLSSATYTRWANWAGRFQDITKDDLIQKMRRAARKTRFRSPISMPSYKRGNDNYGLYSTIAVVEGLETVAEQQNDQLGSDIASKDGEVLFHGRPINWVPQLDENDEGDLIMGINWSTIYPFFQRGEYLKESGPLRAPEQHRVRNIFVDLTWNTMCDDRRPHWILSTQSSTGTTT